MKKLLTILCLAVALSLLCGYALAANDPYADAHVIGQAGLEGLIGTAYKDIGEVEGYDTAAWNKIKASAVCGEYYEIDVWGTTMVGNIEKEVHAKAYVCAFDHEWVNTGAKSEKDVAATCTKDGKDYSHCKNCGKQSADYVKVPALGHVFQLLPVKGKEPTCTAKGQKIMTCIRCGITSGDAVPVDKIDHDFSKLVFVEPKCKANYASEDPDAIMEPGYYYYVCAYGCGTAEEVDENGDPVKTEFTLEQYQNDEIPGLEGKKKAPEGYDGHDWSDWQHNYKPATCTAPAKDRRFCKRCTMEEWRDSEDGPIPHKWVIDTKEALNCASTAEDVKARIKCSYENKLPEGYDVVIIDEVVEDNKTITPKTAQLVDEDGNVVLEIALLHNFVVKEEEGVDNPTKATCVDDSIITKVCTICGEEREEKFADKLGHKLSDWKKEADINGTLVWQRVCERCHEVAETFVGPVPPCRDDEHVYVFDASNEYACGEKKSYVYVCSVCGHKKNGEPEVFNHDWEVNVVKAATCKEDGVEIWTCKLCHKVEVKYPSHALVAHLDVKEIPAKPVTNCLVDGMTAGKFCNYCQQIIEGCEVIKAPGQHTFAVKDGKAPTCTEDGYTSFVECSVCHEVLMESTVLPALGHDLKDEAAVAATCTTAGKEAGKACTRCDYTEGGKAIAALGHAWDEGTVTKEATPTEKGEKVYKCTRCDATRKEDIVFEATEPTKYDVKDVDFDEKEGAFSGSAEHDPYTKEAEKAVYARITFFYTDGTYTVVLAAVAEDGSFETMTSGEVEHISVLIIDSAKIRPSEYNVLSDAKGTDV